jgi:hypothetical protein
MAIHNFHFTTAPVNSGKTSGVTVERAPIITPQLPDQPDLVEKDDLVNSDLNLNQPEDVRSVLVEGFKAMDRGIKAYFSDIRVPTGDDIRSTPMTVRIAGGDKTFLQWIQDLRAGRVKLPVMSINRTGWRFNVEKFSPPHLYMTRKFAHNDGSRVKLVYRPWPALIDYTLSVWTERKRDMEYVIHQIQPRFNPLAEFRIDDDAGLRGNVQLRFGDATDNSDIDIGAEELAKVRYDLTVTMEGWLPLPEKILPAALGRVMTLHEIDGTFLEPIKPNTVSEFFQSPRS